MNDTNRKINSENHIKENEEHIKYLDIANQEAYKNGNNDFKDGGPFGAIVVKDGVIISKSHNTVLKDNDPTAHAEINAIRTASKILETQDLEGCILYTTCYPCPMCMSAIIWANIEEIYYGNTKEDANEIGFRDNDIYDFFKTGKTNIKIKQLGKEKTILLFDIFKNNNGKIY